MGARHTRTSAIGRLAALGVAFGAVFACYAPTQIVLRFKTNLQARNPQTAIQVGVENAFKQGAEGDGRIGELVVVPSGAHDALVEVKVALGVDGVDPDTCFAAPTNPRCVTAKRTYRFADHETRTFDVYMSSTCLGVACGPGKSCDARTSTCTDIRENENDPPMTTPSSPPGDAGEDVVVPVDADASPQMDAPPPACGPGSFTALEAAPRILVGTTDALYWIDEQAQLKRRAKVTAGIPELVASDVSALAASGNVVVWTKGLQAFGRLGNDAIQSCTLAEAPVAIALRPGIQPAGPPSALYASGQSAMHRYPAPSGAAQCTSAASFPASPQAGLAATLGAIWAHSQINNLVGGAPWDFVSNTNWVVSFMASKTHLVASERNFAVVVVTNADGDRQFFRLTAPNGVTPMFVRGGDVSITGLAVDGAFVYWLETPPTAEAPTRLYRAPATANPNVTQVAGFPSQVVAQGLVADESCLFMWAAGNKDPNAGGSIIGVAKGP